MPFTLSHAAAAIPFRRSRLVPSAVVAGCFIPDFEYCFPAGPHTAFGHTIPGLFGFDLPIAFVFLWLFHRYAKEPLWSWMPESFRQRVELGPRNLPFSGFAQLALLVLSILVGSATHLLWDSFTHGNYWPYHHIGFLRQAVTVPVLGRQPAFKLLQHGSSILGLVILWIWWRGYSRSISPLPARDTSTPSGRNRTALFLATLLAIGAGACVIVERGPPIVSDSLIARTIITVASVFWLAVVFYGFIRDRQAKSAESA